MKWHWFPFILLAGWVVVVFAFALLNDTLAAISLVFDSFLFVLTLSSAVVVPLLLVACAAVTYWRAAATRKIGWILASGVLTLILLWILFSVVQNKLTFRL